MTYYIFSTLTCDQHYCEYERNEDKNIPPRVTHKILIKGGTGIATKHLITPRGVMTEVTDDQYAVLQKIPGFLQHVKNGFIKAEQRKQDVEKAVRDMEPQDKSAPITPENYSKRMPALPGTQEDEKIKPSKIKGRDAA